MIMLLQQGIGGLREIRIRGDEAARVESFRRTWVDVQNLDRKLLFGSEFGRYYIETTFFVGFGVIAAAQILTQGDSAFASLAVMLAAGFRLLPSAGRLLGGVNSARAGRGSLSVLTDELDAMGIDRLSDVVIPADSHVTERSLGPARVEIDHVSYRYPSSDRAAVSDLNVVVEAGASLGLVGASGSGKSTAADLICGLLVPMAGEVRVGGCSTTNRRDRPRIAYVPQDVFLLEGTVAENIHFASGPVDHAAMSRAIDTAQLGEWIASLPHGLDTEVGERGALVSGGQRQRIGIARALYQSPSVMVLDEATSALDVETEAALTEAIKTIGQRTTLIVIAHRLSTVRSCDQILLLDDGSAAALGSYDELAAEDSTFARWVGLATAELSSNR
jgi:ABC-type multidrug transport system fused ATPase/permease subunit